ncbi:MAG: CRISPR-associated endonuclease Cas2 [Betaproteobacteria bacterium]|nr:CRISPR-associated endonuclease Cas2 [Betaproteobacteria bacterium]
MSVPRPAIVAYDVSANRTRRRVRRVLDAWRLDGQKSVIECRLSRPDAEELMIQLGELIDRKTDRLLLAWMDTRREARARGVGRIGAVETLRTVA